MTRRSPQRRFAVRTLVLAALVGGCGGGPASDGACEAGHPDCVDEDTVDLITPPADPS